ncbi:MAG: hypothetical protein ICV79_20250, partial [Flavisolibacter sp.]|nr:hypothetical protein [Flavisolibacter sp.]
FSQEFQHRTGTQTKSHHHLTVFYEIIFRDSAANELEKKILEDFGVRIEWEKKDPLDEAFGLWRKGKRTLNKLRDKAWQRTK